MEESLARNLWLFAQLLFKAGMMTGLLPAMVMAACMGRSVASSSPRHTRPANPTALSAELVR